MAPTPCRLLDLADELLIAIIEHLHNDSPALHALSHTSAHLRPLAENVLYRDPLIRRPATLHRLLQNLHARPQRREYIHTLDARCEYRPYRAPAFASLPSLLEQAPQLRELTIESALANCGRWQSPDERNYEYVRDEWPPLQAALSRLFHRAACREDAVARELERPLRHLRRVELHLSGYGSRFWDVDEHAQSLFMSPTLQVLIVSCAQFGGEEFGTELAEGATPLRRLTLIECSLTLSALRCMLRLPKALQYLHLGENCHHRHRGDASTPSDGLCGRSPSAFFDGALAFQSSSLEELVYDVAPHVPPPESHHVPTRGFADFPELHTVTLRGHQCPAFEAALWGAAPNPPPPPLQTLRLAFEETRSSTPAWHDDDTGQAFWAWATVVVAALPSLRQLECAADRSTMAVKDARARSWRSLSGFEDMLGRRGVAFRLFARRRWGGLIPPYLYGEKPTADLLVYASDGPGFGEGYAVDVESDDPWQREQ
ncbi:hypothetical protein LTR53_014109 [Teratosphaeriaceae sp. CCFEE 6253]|nr:hypothetical protein LTR53_014109 [Teratosphaeriaceae sp. CCFEE 6253]